MLLLALEIGVVHEEGEHLLSHGGLGVRVRGVALERGRFAFPLLQRRVGVCEVCGSRCEDRRLADHLRLDGRHGLCEFGFSLQRQRAQIVPAGESV